MRWNSNRSLVSCRRRLGRFEGVIRRAPRLAVELLEPRSMMAADCGSPEPGVAIESALLTGCEPLALIECAIVEGDSGLPFEQSLTSGQADGAESYLSFIVEPDSDYLSAEAFMLDSAGEEESLSWLAASSFMVTDPPESLWCMSLFPADTGLVDSAVCEMVPPPTDLVWDDSLLSECQPVNAWCDEPSLPNEVPVDELSASAAVDPEIVVDPAVCYDGEWLLGVCVDIDATAMSSAEMLTLADDSGVVGDDGAQVTIETESAAQAAFSGLSAAAGAADRAAGTSGISARLFAAFGFSLPSAGEDLLKPGTGKRRHR